MRICLRITWVGVRFGEKLYAAFLDQVAGKEAISTFERISIFISIYKIKVEFLNFCLAKHRTSVLEAGRRYWIQYTTQCARPRSARCPNEKCIAVR